MPQGTSAYIGDTKPEPLYSSMQLVTGGTFNTSPEPYGTGDYASVVYPTGAAVVYPYTP
jgi:hypothetical protein